LIVSKSVIFVVVYLVLIYKLDISDDLKDLLRTQPIIKNFFR